MRGLSGVIVMAGLAFAAALPPGQVWAEPAQEVTGNWAGKSNQGFYFRAAIKPSGDALTLQIWSGTDAVPPRSGNPDLNAKEFALSAFAKVQGLEVVETADGSVLQLVIEFADEVAEGRTVVSVQFLDFQYTVIGYSYQDQAWGEGDPVTYSCEVDLRAGKVTEDGKTRDLPPMDFESMNASAWHYYAPFERGWCSTAEEG